MHLDIQTLRLVRSALSISHFYSVGMSVEFEYYDQQHFQNFSRFLEESVERSKVVQIDLQQLFFFWGFLLI